MHALIDATAIEGRMDATLQSDDPELMDWWYDEKYQLDTNRDTTGSTNITDAGLDEHATRAEFVDSLATGSAPSTAPPGKNDAANVKVEKLSEPASEVSLVQKVKASKTDLLLKYQAFLLQVRTMKVRATGNRYHDNILEDVDKHLVSCNKVTKMLELLASGEDVADDKVCKLAKTLPDIETQHKTLVEHALLFGFVDKEMVPTKRVEAKGGNTATKRRRKAA